MKKFIFVIGGVISGVGKGITSASIGKIVQAAGYTTKLIKVDPYINCDAGTLRPTEHGEVWVTADGGEIDQDMGTYERFLDQDSCKDDSITTGQVYKSVIEKERSGHYLGATVQFIPHIPQEIIDRLYHASQNYECVVVEIGGTVGDFENIPFLFAAKMIERDIGAEHVAYVLVSYLPIPHHIQEMKTKPTQQAIKLLREEGIFPDFVICRSHRMVDAVRKHKIASFVHIPFNRIISAPDLDSIYQVPLYLNKEGFDEELLARLQLPKKQQYDWNEWQSIVDRMLQAPHAITIGIVGKYVTSGDYDIQDSYVSVVEALRHAGAAHNVRVKVQWIDAALFETESIASTLSHCDGILLPGGFGTTGVEGKIQAIAYARNNSVPFLGLCYGLQLAVVEYARHKAGLEQAHTQEVNVHTPHPVITLLADQSAAMTDQQYGGTMRLGSYPAQLQQGSTVYSLYEKAGWLETVDGQSVVYERHRHRYEVNPWYVQQLADAGLVFSGTYQRGDGTTLVEFLELDTHPFFIATQAHPEFRSRFGKPHPLFVGFVQAAMRKAGLV